MLPTASDTDLLTKADLAAFQTRLRSFMLAAISVQTALIVGLIQLLK
jgi:hypothetical protein